MQKFYKLTAALCAVFLLSLCFFCTVAYAAPEDETSEPPAETVTESAPTVETTTPEDDFIIGTLPPGTGTVVDAFTDEDGRKFYTIQTPAGNTFYLIIDFTKQGEHVYFLDAVNEKDLLALAEKAAANPGAESSNPGANANSSTTSAPSGNQTKEPKPEASGGNNMFSMILVVIVVVIGGGAGVYFKVIKKKQNNDRRDEYEDEEEYIPDEPEDNSVPWEEDEDV